MSDPPSPPDDIGVELGDAYSVETPADNLRLYASWATTYDREFLATHGYVYHESVVAALLDRSHPSGPVLDVGCGTGVVGIELRRRGVDVVDGVDLSPEMLAVAAEKTTGAGDRVYRELITADLTQPTAISNRRRYAAVVSAGTFTHGHLGPEPIGELLRVAQPGAVFALGVNADHFAAAGFGDWFRTAIEHGRVVDLEIVERPIYDPQRYDAPDAAQHATTSSAVAVFASRSGD